MKAHLAAGALALGLIAASAAIAQAPPPATEAGAPLRALVNLPAKGKLTVSTPAFKDGADIPFENTQYRGNVFPGLMWSKGPSGTKSYAVIMQDTDGIRNNMPIFHWSLVNVPASVTKLDAGMSAPPEGSMYGPNIRGKMQAYMGPRTPAGPKHRYHLQVFALDTTVTGDVADYDALINALKDHVLASGEVVGLGQVDPTAPPPAPRPAQ